MSEYLEQEEDEEGGFDAEAAEQQESVRLEGVAREIDSAASFPMLFGIGLITSLFNRPAKNKEEEPKPKNNERRAA
ncbi:MAG: hypothetical protein Q7R85_02665 [bacterium]|nr:hypothetical protein [bacterium]